MQRGHVRERYVLQVLLVTVGFGLLLGVFAVVETPKDWSQPATDAMAKPLEAASRFADFQDECLPFDLTAREAQAPAKQHCEETDPSLRGLRSE
jgi:hypothetical protein